MIPTIRKGRDNGSNYGKSDIDAWQEFENYPRNVLKFDLDSDSFHPTQKPLALFEYLIRTYTNEAEVVLDNCMGSGTTAVACLNTDRKYIGFETNKEYFDKSMERIKSNVTQLDLFG